MTATGPDPSSEGRGPRSASDGDDAGAAETGEPVPEHDHEPATVPARATQVWGMSDRERDAELDRFQRLRPAAARNPVAVRLAVALVLLLSAAVAVWSAMLALG